jgi:NADH-quinone oxidoreductase subunit M
VILSWIIFLPFLGGLLAWYTGRRHADAARWVSVAALAVDLILLLTLLASSGVAGVEGSPSWLVEFERPWITGLGIGFHIAMDGLSLLLVGLSLLLGILSVLTSWTEIRERVGSFHLNLLWTLSGVIGVFLALDLFLFYVFWELMLVPMYFLIALWGHENRTYASMKFFIFTQCSGLLMLIAILGLYFIHGSATGIYTFDYQQLLGMTVDPSVSMWLMLGFFIAFAVKVPAVPFHSWLPDAHTEAPTAGSVILAGLLLKTGAYGLLRFMVPLFPVAVTDFAPVGMSLAVAGILYGAFLASAQHDLKRLVAYTSISHMGFVLLGVFAWNELALQGVVMQMLCHGISTGGLFILAGALQERIHTRDMGRMGGLWSSLPKMGGVAMVFAMASLGLPGLGNFIGEFLVLFGTWQRSSGMAIVAAVGLVAATVYALVMIQKVFHGTTREERRLTDATLRELSVATVMIILLVVLGLYPQPVIKTAEPVLHEMQDRVSSDRSPVPGTDITKPIREEGVSDGHR